MKKKVLFCYADLITTGSAIVLMEALKGLKNDPEIEYELLIKRPNEDNFKSLLEKEEIKYELLITKDLCDKVNSYSKQKKNILKRLIHKFYRLKEDIYSKKKFIQISKGKDIIIDFTGTDFYKYFKKSKNKRISWIHNSIEGQGKKREKVLRERLVNYERIVSICDEMSSEIKEYFPNLKNKVRRIYNPFNFERIEKLSRDKSSLNEQENIMINNDYMIALTRLDDNQKDINTLLKAFKLAKENGVKEKLYIAGEGDARAKIENWIKEYKLEKDVCLLGLQKNPYVWLANSKYFVHSSNYEGLPTVLIESMVLNRVVISTNCPTGPKEILENGKVGFLVDIGDYEAMSEKMVELSTNIEKRKEYEKLGYESAKRFSIEKVLVDYKKIILEK